jgi:hypothetical protein
LAIMALMPYIACICHLLFLVLILLMISAMLVSWANTPDCIFQFIELCGKAFDLMHLDIWTS